MAWISLYFSAAVWSSLALCGIYLLRDRLPEYRSHRPSRLLPVSSRLAAPPSASG